MRSLNEVRLIGNVGRDAEVKFTAGGIARVTFSIATERTWKDRQTGEYRSETDWHNIVLWRSEKLAEYLVKGARVFIGGRIQTREYEKSGERRFVTEIVAENVILLGERRGGGGAGRGDACDQTEPPAASADPFPPGVIDDDVPF